MVDFINARSKFQNIRITEDYNHPGDWILYLDDLFQLSTFSEFKYHESLVTMPMCMSPNIDRVLICGGGDGMSLREALRFKYCKPTLVELDPGMIEIFRDMPQFAKYNNNSLIDSKASIITGDAIEWMEKELLSKEKYNCIFWDFPSPPDGVFKSNLFNVKNIETMIGILENDGVFATHISIPIPTMVMMIQTLKKYGFNCWVYDAYYDLYGNHDSFLVASKRRLKKERLTPESCRWANNDRLRIGFSAATEVIKEDEEYFLNFLEIDDFEQ